jgi:hypothetical protein
MFCMLLFNSVNYVFLLLCLCILIVLYILFSPRQLALFGYPDWVFPCFFLSCKANTRVGHGPHSSQFGDNFYAVISTLILVLPLWVRIPESFQPELLIVLSCVLFVCKCVLYCTVLLPPAVNPIAVKKYIHINKSKRDIFDVSTSYISFDRGAAREKCDVTARVSRTGYRHTSLWQR